MKVSQVAAQLYTIRDYLKTKDGVRESLARLRKIGYEAVELASVGVVSTDELASLLKEAGLKCCSSHEDPNKILNEPETMIERLKTLGCECVAMPVSGVKMESLNDVKMLARRMNEAGRMYHKNGITLSYHNHSVEFHKCDGRLALEVLYEETDPKFIHGQIDTYWVQFGGGDATDWCEKLAGRLITIHLKDYKILADGKPTFAEVGQGNLKWNEIVNAAEKSGAEWYIVEQDSCERDPFESVEMSINFIRTHLSQ